jgi:putative membrane protein
MPKLDEASFDRAWLEQMVEDHQTDIAAFQKAGKSVTDPDLKNFITKTLPVLQKHLKAVQQAQAKSGGGKTTDQAN